MGKSAVFEFIEPASTARSDKDDDRLVRDEEQNETYGEKDFGGSEIAERESCREAKTQLGISTVLAR